jgi:hypothetical protein
VNCFQNRSLFYKNEIIPHPCGYRGQYISIRPVFSNEEYTLQREGDFIAIDFLLEGDRQISIYDISGKLYYKRDRFSGKKLTIPNAAFPNGFYLLKVQNRDTNQINVNKISL